MPTPARISACLTTAGATGFSTAVDPVCSITSLSRICSRPDGIVQEVRFALGEGRDLFQIRAVDVLPQPDRGNGDLVLRRLPGERHAVAFLGNAVGQQHDVLVDGIRGQDLAVSFGERRGDLRAAVGRDAGHQAFDRRAIVGALRIGTVHWNELSKMSTPTRSMGRRFSITPIEARRASSIFLPSMDDDLSMMSTTQVPSGERGGASLAGSARSTGSSTVLFST